MDGYETKIRGNTKRKKSRKPLDACVLERKSELLNVLEGETDKLVLPPVLFWT